MPTVPNINQLTQPATNPAAPSQADLLMAAATIQQPDAKIKRKGKGK